MLDFFLDERALVNLLGNLQKNIEGIKQIIDSMEAVLASGHATFSQDQDVYSLQVGGSSVADLIFQDGGNNRDSLRRLHICLGRMEGTPANAAGPQYGTDLLAKVGTGAIISLDELSQYGWWKPDKMYALFAASELAKSLRFLFLAEGLDEANFTLLIEEMFPDLYFVDKPDCKKLGIKYVDNIDKLIVHLSWLNDHANDAFSRHPEQDFAAHAAKYKVLISPESPQTHKNKKAERERTIVINGKSLYCEWHSKFYFDKGRIHFYPYRESLDAAIKNTVGKKLIVGVVADHLT